MIILWRKCQQRHHIPEPAIQLKVFGRHGKIAIGKVGWVSIGHIESLLGKMESGKSEYHLPKNIGRVTGFLFTPSAPSGITWRR